ncbi:MAG TPA: substrate-binding domain-containing protein [Actinocrinis sp.]|uniref:substrate-binding domain-containing protein n=1 Tax=Actinocrinis sp. TaxID=1920516 RepID=UPI002DDDB055|nr:substrate-binding domain-containing protein [Actinocrinis sp.]HEV2344255.1 substrate-binding domain-containing protein [Actinocrinis sp.]
MLAQQRHAYVLERLSAQGAVRVTEVVAMLGVSDGTVRRDLEILEQQGLLMRVRGGAVPTTAATAPISSAPLTAESAQRPPGTASRGGAMIGMLVPSTTYYYPEVIRGAQESAARAGARLVLGVTDYGGDRDLDQLRALIRSGSDGLLVTPAVGPVITEPVRDLVEGCGVPYVLVERRSAATFDHAEYVLSDHRQGAYRAVEHLARLGHRGVALFAHFTPTTKPVVEGHAAAVQRLGLDASAPVMAPEDGTDRLAAIDAFADACRDCGATAALVHSDQEAILLVQRLRTREVRIPEDLAVIAYDDEVAAFAQVPLTAVAPPKYEVGRAAATALLARIGVAGDPPIRQTVLLPKLVVRTSCGAALRARDAETGSMTAARLPVATP